MNSNTLIVWFIFAVNFTVFLICDGRPWAADNNAVEESGDFELQPRFIDPISLTILSIAFLIAYIGRKIVQRRSQAQYQQYPQYPYQYQQYQQYPQYPQYPYRPPNGRR